MSNNAGSASNALWRGSSDDDWQEVDKILSLFGARTSSARKAYRLFVEAGMADGRRPELKGGGLIRGSGGWKTVKARRNNEDHPKGDERILGVKV